ncbi:MAG: inositol monophosphatase family protein [Chloroflexi bacterium]|nr:inositol monophosphatase family protein [Chloroflexota bacterium]
MALDVEEALAVARSAAKRAGEATLRYFDQPIVADRKRTRSDLLTKADLAAEAILVQEIGQAFPDHALIGEEGGAYGTGSADATHRWYLDPVDGTTNFVQGIPIYGVSVALTDAERQPLVAVVLNPVYGREFIAMRGSGAFLADRRLQVSAKTALADAVVASGFPYDKWESADDNLLEWGVMTKQTRGIRRLGAAALDLCFVAMGRLDAYWERRLNPWDVLAGILIVEEAGGRISDFSGRRSEDALLGKEIVASNGRLHEATLSVLRGVNR